MDMELRNFCQEMVGITAEEIEIGLEHLRRCDSHRRECPLCRKFHDYNVALESIEMWEKRRKK